MASAMAKGPPFPYTFGDRVDVDESIWTLYNGTKRVCLSKLARHITNQHCANGFHFQEDGSNCSIFAFDITTGKGRLPLAKNALKKLRTLRHPGVIKVLDAVEVRHTKQRNSKQNKKLTKSIATDGNVHLYRDRARSSATLACTTKELKPRDDQMGIA